MNSCVAQPREQQAALETGSAPAQPQGPRDEVFFAWSMVGTSGWTALDDDEFDSLLLLCPGTSSGRRRVSDPPPSQSVLNELRSRTQLTWAQLARALGVQRRSLHFWARGERPSATNLERLLRLAGIVRAIDRGNAADTTRALLEPHRDGLSAFALLCEGRDDEVLELLSVRPSPTVESSRGRRRRPPQLTPEERARRQGLSPVERLDAVHDTRVPNIGPLIASVAVPWRRD
jgi:transcriptional regulator with XRE-family HTH domain